MSGASDRRCKRVKRPGARVALGRGQRRAAVSGKAPQANTQSKRSRLKSGERKRPWRGLIWTIWTLSKCVLMI